MLQLSFIRSHSEEVVRRLEIKRFKNAAAAVAEIIELDAKKRGLQKESDQLKSEANKLSKEIGVMMGSGRREEAELVKASTAAMKSKEKELSQQLESCEDQLHQKLVQLPNLPSMDVPVGEGMEQNLKIHESGIMPKLAAGALTHWELAKKYDLIDFELGVKITGAGFPVYKGKGAKFQRALIQFFLDEATAAGYLEIQPPLLVNAESGFGTGQLPDKEGQMYHVQLDNLYLIPTAEVPVTNMYRDVILKESDLPVKNCAYSACFRREAGSYGKEVRGLNRLHQFDKVEIVQIVHPEKSYQVLEGMREYVGGLLQKLGLPYRVMKLCGGDMGFASALTYDFEVWCAAQSLWLEVSSVSNFESYQTHRMMCRFKDDQGKIQLCHSLNGSALALPRIVASLLENNQVVEGIHVPDVLQPYTGFKLIQ